MLLKQTRSCSRSRSLSLLFTFKEIPAAAAHAAALSLFGLLGLAIPLGVLAVAQHLRRRPAARRSTRGRRSASRGATASAPTRRRTRRRRWRRSSRRRPGPRSKTAKLVLEGYREAPLELPKLFLKKLATFFNVYEVPDNANFYFFRDRLAILKVLPVFPCLLGAGLVGLFAALTRGVLRRDEAAARGRRDPRAARGLSPRPDDVPLPRGGDRAARPRRRALLSLHLRRNTRPPAARGSAFSLRPRVRCPSFLLLPSVIPAGRHRFSDTLVYATIVEGQDGPAAAAAEVRRYLEEGGDDTRRQVGVAAVRYWAESGDRSSSLVEPSGHRAAGKRLRAWK